MPLCLQISTKFNTVKLRLSVRSQDQSNDGYKNRQIIEKVLKITCCLIQIQFFIILYTTHVSTYELYRISLDLKKIVP